MDEEMEVYYIRKIRAIEAERDEQKTQTDHWYETWCKAHTELVSVKEELGRLRAEPYLTEG